MFHASPGRIPRRGNAGLHVRHCEEQRDEAIQASFSRWIASLSLAMTLLFDM